jgi:hypothetical protein
MRQRLAATVAARQMIAARTLICRVMGGNKTVTLM